MALSAYPRETVIRMIVTKFLQIMLEDHNVGHNLRRAIISVYDALGEDRNDYEFEKLVAEATQALKVRIQYRW